MQWRLPGLALLLCACVLAFLLTLSGVDSGSPAAISSPHPKADPYDSIRTDLRAYLWPTDAGHIVTSTFGEYRQTHFHAGIDISTGDRIGYHVFATRRGYVSRIRVEPTGYGKMLYVRHDDGYTSTYAHLSRFAPEIQARVHTAQMHLERYPVDLQCAPTDFPVEQGEVIAFTGETGIGSPHLHFEIRDEHMNAVNPLLCPGFRIPDHIPPAFRKIAFIPLGPNDEIDGKHDPLIFRPRARGPNASELMNPVRIYGRAGIGAFVRDRCDGTYYSRGVYDHRLFIDSTLCFEVRMDRVPTADAQQIGLYYVRDLLSLGEGRFEKLYVDTPNEMPFLIPRNLGAGTIDPATLGTGTHSFRVVSEDINGNRSTVLGTFVLSLPPQITSTRSGSTVLLQITPAHSAESLSVDTRRFSEKNWTPLAIHASWDSSGARATLPIPGTALDLLRIRAVDRSGGTSFPSILVLSSPTGPRSAIRLKLVPRVRGCLIELSTPGLFTSAPSLFVEEGGARRRLQTTEVDEHQARAYFQPADSIQGERQVVFEGDINGFAERTVEPYRVFPIVPGRNGTISLDNGNLLVTYDALSVYDRLDLRVEISGEEGAKVYHLLPEKAVLRNGLLVSVKPLRSASHQALYRRSGRTWSLMGRPTSRPEGYFTGRLGRWLSDLTVLSDTVKPFVTGLRLRRQGRGLPLVSFHFGDDCSGVDYEELKTYIDGVFVVPEIDGEHRRAVIEPNDPLPRGSHRLTIQLQDHLGNASVAERQFHVP